MKKFLHLAAVLLLATAVRAAEKDEVLAAAKKLADSSGYSWKSTVEVPADSQFRPGPTNGKTEKDGATYISMMFRENLTEAILKGEKGAVTNQDGDWESLAELENAEGGGRFRAMMLRNLKLPAKQAEDLANGARELKKADGVISGELTADGAKQFLTFGRPRDGGDGPTVSNASGSVKFWVKDGALEKFEFKVKGTVSFNGNDRDVDRTTTVEISKIGETKVNVPEAAKKKLS